MGGVVARRMFFLVFFKVLTVQRTADQTAMWFAIEHGHRETGRGHYYKTVTR
jgi:hypothetical protein